ncbi:YtxH domain-containing protein [Mycoplasmatota bacterium]|nr:YtxH domain-containing protein [Mycoplasmatota bacterium]
MLDIIYITLGIILIACVLAITYFGIRFLENYRSTLKQADITIRVAETSFQELDRMVLLFTDKLTSAEQFFNELNKTGQNLETVNNKFDEILNFIEKYPKGMVSSLFLLNKIDSVKELPKIFNVLNFDEELNSVLKDFIKGAVVGGLAVAFLTPKTGEDMRKVAMEKLDELAEKAKGINAEEVRDGIFNKIEELKTYITTSSKDEILNRIFEEIKNLYDKVKGYLSFKQEPTTEIIEKQ